MQRHQTTGVQVSRQARGRPQASRASSAIVTRAKAMLVPAMEMGRKKANAVRAAARDRSVAEGTGTEPTVLDPAAAQIVDLDHAHAAAAAVHHGQDIEWMAA